MRQKLYDLSGLRWETRGDESYLTIESSEAQYLAEVDLVESAVQSGYLNLDMLRFEQILKKASGQPECVGPAIRKMSPERLAWIEARVDQKIGQVWIKLDPQCFTPGQEITLRELEHSLNRIGVKAGILFPELSDVIKRKHASVFVLAAQRKDEQPGLPAKILTKVSFAQHNKPKLLPDGSVDFRNLDAVIHVKEGRLLALKIPPGKGVDGMNLDGSIRPGPMGEDVPFEGGKGTKISEDGRELLCGSDGFLYEDLEGRLCVGNLYVVDGDLGFKTGNLNYDGDVLVRGDVKSGFEIHALGNVLVEGDVEAAVIFAKGNIQIEGGVFGKSKATLSAGGDLTLRQAQDCALEAKGTLKFALRLAQCTIHCKELLGTSASSTVVGCEISAKSLVSVGVFGAQGANSVRVKLISDRDEDFRLRIAEAEALKQKAETQSQALLRRLQSMKNILKMAVEITPKSAEELQKVHESYLESKNLEETFVRKIALLDKNRKDRRGYKGRVEFEKNLAPLEIEILGEQWQATSEVTRKRVMWDGEAIAVESLQSEWRPGRKE